MILRKLKLDHNALINKGFAWILDDQMKLTHSSSNYFFKKSPFHYHTMFLVMSAFKQKQNLSVEKLKTKLFKTYRPKSA